MKKLLLALLLCCSPAFADGLLIPPSQVGVAPIGQIPGTVTNDNAATGKIGEYVESVIPLGSAVALTTGTSTNITSISLTAGDWDITALGAFLPTATTSSTEIAVSVSTTSGTFGTLGSQGSILIYPATVTGGLATAIPSPTVRLSISSTTTVYMVSISAFTASTMGGFGTLRARRVR